MLNIKDYEIIGKKTPISDKLIMFTGGFLDKSRSELKSLAENLGAKVEINYNQKGKGKLVISYANLDELDGILSQIQPDLQQPS